MLEEHSKTCWVELFLKNLHGFLYLAFSHSDCFWMVWAGHDVLDLEILKENLEVYAVMCWTIVVRKLDWHTMRGKGFHAEIHHLNSIR